MTKERENQKIGRYTLLKTIGKGGMGEVFLAYDPICERNVALKCIREDLKEKKAIRARFLREARIASQLTHPSIVPIYTIHSDPENLYYTMSHVEGETLRQILKKTKEQERKGFALHSIGGSIPALCRIFLNVCEATAYTHSRKILHRDLKPENLIIGKYGEVMILDWGIADNFPKPNAKKTDKVAGTVAFMAPERALGQPATPQTEIYSLGVILYQLLTLDLPFRRGNLEAFRKTMEEEEFLDPIELAPYREIPPELVQIVKKCLAFSPKDRYLEVEDLIEDLKNAIEGKPDWIFTNELNLKKKEDWEFQENILIAKHTAITRHIEESEWVSLMVSKETFSGNIRLDAKVKMHPKTSGIGILLGVPEMTKRRSLDEGYCVWISVDETPRIQLFRSNILVIDAKEERLTLDTWHHVKIEKTNDHVRFFLDNVSIFTYSSHLPLTGAHVGFIHKDTSFEFKDFRIYSGSHNVMVNCLAVPDAFFAHKDYDTALTEYRRIGRSFPGRAEGRDALFKAGITLLERAKNHGERGRQKLLYAALDEFENLHNSPGAPLEYLGKALVYKEMNAHEEEVKCLELALRKFPKHPQLPVLKEHIVYRMHESAEMDRESAYRLILLVIRYFPSTLKDQDMKSLIENLQKHWETLPFIEDSDHTPEKIAVTLAFWIARKETLSEMVRVFLKKTPLDTINLENALFSMVELGAYRDVRNLLNECPKEKGLSQIKCALLQTDNALRCLFESTTKTLHRKEVRVLLHILKKMLIRKEYKKITRVRDFLGTYKVEKEDAPFLDALFYWNFLLENKRSEAEAIAKKNQNLDDERSPFFSPYGAYLFKYKSPHAAKRHFASDLDKPFPNTTALLRYFLNGKIDGKSGWIKSAFSYEKEELYFQLTLFYRTIGEMEEAKKTEKKLHDRFTRTHRKKSRS